MTSAQIIFDAKSF